MDIKSLLMAALQSGATHETIQTLAGMLDKQQAAERAFHDDLRLVRAVLQAVHKDKDAGKWVYADLAAVTRHLAPILTEHGFGWHFESHATADRVTVTCVLSHKGGHATSASLSGPIVPQQGNLYQGLGMAVTYMERYTLGLVSGLPASKDKDAVGLGEDRRRGPQLPKGRAAVRPTEREDAGSPYQGSTMHVAALEGIQKAATIDVEAAAIMRDMAEEAGVSAAEIRKWLKGLGADKYTAIPAARAQEARDTLAVLVSAAERRKEG